MDSTCKYPQIFHFLSKKYKSYKTLSKLPEFQKYPVSRKQKKLDNVQAFFTLTSMLLLCAGFSTSKSSEYV